MALKIGRMGRLVRPTPKFLDSWESHHLSKAALKRSLNFSIFIDTTGTLILAHCVKQSQEFDSAIVKRNSSPPLLCLSKNIFRGLCLKCSSLCNVKPPYHRLILYRFLNTLTKILKHAKNHNSSVFPSKNLVKYILPLFY